VPLGEHGRKNGETGGVPGDGAELRLPVPSKYKQLSGSYLRFPEIDVVD
jgi:hypothetical protein